MINKKVPQRQKTRTSTLIKRCWVAPITVVLIGAYFMPLGSSNLRVEAQSSISETSTTASTPLPTSKLSTTRQAQGKQSDRGRPQPDQTPPGAGTRGGCPQVEKPLTALLPKTKRVSDDSQNFRLAKTISTSTLGLTTAKHPTLWFYIPYSLTPSHRIEFVLQDEQGNDVYETSLTKSDISPGVVGLQIPSTAPSLKVNQVYRWYFLVYCDPKQPEALVFVEGLVKRVPMSSSLESQMAQATADEKAALYAKAGMWPEAVTSLAKLRQQNPEDAALKEDWVNLLKSMNLDAIAQEPITTVLTPQQ
jgi:hypothetical protein